MARIRAVCLGWYADDPQPGLVDVSIQDAFGVEHRIVEKVAVIGPVDAGPSSSYPINFWIEGVAVAVVGENLRVRLPYGIETTAGETEITFAVADVELL